MFIHYLNLILLFTISFLVFPVQIILNKKNTYFSSLFVYFLILLNFIICYSENMEFKIYNNFLNLNLEIILIIIISSFLLVAFTIVFEFFIVLKKKNNINLILPEANLQYLLFIIIFAIFEEIIFRQIFIYIANDLLNLTSWQTVFLSTFAFLLNHFKGIKYKISWLLKFLLGIILSINFILFNSVFICIMLHLSYNLMYFYLVKLEYKKRSDND